MRKSMLLAAMLSVTVLMFAASPAMAQDWNDDWNDRWWDDDFDRDFGDVSQDIEQEAESGDVEQSFDVSGTGDNSNQTVSTQGVANTGNVQNAIGVSGFGNGGDFEFDDVGSSIEVSPTNITSSDQQVNQAASAFGR